MHEENTKDLMEGLVIHPGGEQQVVCRETFDLKFLQEVVDGSIQLVKDVESRDMVINESGTIDGLAENQRATELLHSRYKEGWAHNVKVHGSVFILLKGKLS